MTDGVVVFALVTDGALTEIVGGPSSKVYVAVVVADLLPAWSQAITATDVVAAGIAIVPPEDSIVPEAQSLGAVTEVPDAVA